MHIAYLHYLYGQDSALNHVRQFSAAARRLGHRLDVVAMNLAPPERRPHGAASRPWLRIRAAIKRRLSRYLHEVKELAWNPRYVAREIRLLRALGCPDVLLVRDDALTASCVPVARRLDLPLVLEVNAPAAEAGLYLDQYWHLPGVAGWLERWKLRRADGVTVVSGALRDYLVERHDLSAAKVTVVPNGADLERFRPDVAADPQLPAAFLERGGGPVVGFVGSFQAWHGSELLAEMIAAVAAARPGVRFLLVGGGPGLAALRARTAALGARVHSTGPVPHARVPGLVAALDVAVVPQAGFYMSPLKVIEWMAAGRAVAAPRLGPLEELIDDGEHGLLFPPGDRAALIRAVLTLIDDPDLRARLGAAAAARARADLSWSDNARRVLAACEAAIARHGERRKRAA